MTKSPVISAKNRQTVGWVNKKVYSFSPQELLQMERAAMTCTPAQMRLALHRMGLLAQVQGIADADTEASIVWEYATQIVRNSPFIEALGGDFTGSEIDEIFRAAMAVQT